MSIEDCILWWRSTHPELFFGWVGLLLVDLVILLAAASVDAFWSASACKIENEEASFIEWRWDL